MFIPARHELPIYQELKACQADSDFCARSSAWQWKRITPTRMQIEAAYFDAVSYRRDAWAALRQQAGQPTYKIRRAALTAKTEAEAALHRCEWAKARARLRANLAYWGECARNVRKIKAALVEYVETHPDDYAAARAELSKDAATARAKIQTLLTAPADPLRATLIANHSAWAITWDELAAVYAPAMKLAAE